MATCRPFDHGVLPEVIYFDTSFLVSAVLGQPDERQEARRFLKRLHSYQTHVVASVLVLIESWNAALKVLLIDRYGKNDWYNLYELPAVRMQFMPAVQGVMHEFNNVLAMFTERNPPQGEIAHFGAEDLQNAARSMVEYGLLSADAAHVGFMQTYDIRDVATLDADFLLVDSLTLWLPYDLCQKYRRRL